MPLAGLVDTAVLGHLDDVAQLAGVGLGSVVFDVLLWSFGFLRMGTTGLVAQAAGRGEPVEAVRIGLRALMVALGIAAVVFALRDLAGAGAFAVLEGAADVELAGRAYYDARILAVPATLGGFAVTGWLLGRGASRAVLVLAAVTHGTNATLDIALVWGLGLGAWGAGIATAVAQGVAFPLGLWLAWRQLEPGQIRAARAGLGDLRALRDLALLNVDIMVRTLSLVGVFTVFTDFSAVFGTIVLGANTVLLKVLSLAAWFIDGVAFATETLAGELRGAADRDGLRELLLRSIELGMGLGMGIAVAFLVAPDALLGVLTDQPAVLAEARQRVVWLLPLIGIGSVAYILDGYFLGRSEGPTLRNAMLVSALVGFLPLAVLARTTASVNLLWFALAVFMVARVVTLGAAVPASLRR